MKGVSGNPAGRPPGSGKEKPQEPNRQENGRRETEKGEGRPALPESFQTFGAEAAARLRAIADDPDTPVKLRAEIEWFFFEGVYGKASSRSEKDAKPAAAPQPQIIKFEGVLEEWSK